MPSPFPGMNPYLEKPDVWHDFHESFMPRVRDNICAQVDPRYVVKIDEHVFIHEFSADERRFLGRGDITLAKDEGRKQTTPESATGTAVLNAPVEVSYVATDDERLAFIEIRDRKRRQLVTVVELLSPINKRPGPDREVYMAKRRALIYSGVNLVEIDLLRVGERTKEDIPPCDYCIQVSRGIDWPRAGVWPLKLADRLPTIPIPLLPPDADARLDLQEVLHSIYDAARYGTYVYDDEPDPPLPAEAASWAKGFVPTRM